MKYVVAIVCFFFITQSVALSIEAGAWLGGTNSFNDINNNSSFSTIRPAGGVIGKYNFNERIAAEAMFSFGKTYSADNEYENTDFTIARNERTRTKALDIQLAGEFNFLSFGGQYFTNSSVYTPYLSLGVGLSLLNAEVYSAEVGDYVDVKAINAEPNQSFKPTQVNVPIAAGVKYELSDHFVLAAEAGSRFLFTDGYDGFSETYTQDGIDSNPGEITTVGRQRGDRSRWDSYNLFGLQLTYRIPFDSCP